jgi:hypothetical protein
MSEQTMNSEISCECSTNVIGDKTILIEQPEGRRPLGRLKHRRDNNIKIHKKETSRECVY